MSEFGRPQVGIGLLIVKNDLIMLGQRKSSHGAGEFGGPGGHFEYDESFEDSIIRELREEAGEEIVIKDLRFLCITNLRKYLPKHYVDIGMVAEWESGEPEVTEPDKLESWGWYPMDDLPVNLFACMNNYIEAYRTGCAYFPEA